MGLTLVPLGMSLGCGSLSCGGQMCWTAGNLKRN